MNLLELLLYVGKILLKITSFLQWELTRKNEFLIWVAGEVIMIGRVEPCHYSYTGESAKEYKIIKCWSNKKLIVFKLFQSLLGDQGKVIEYLIFIKASFPTLIKKIHNILKKNYKRCSYDP